jgi:hypothetical protein
MRRITMQLVVDNINNYRALLEQELMKCERRRKQWDMLSIRTQWEIEEYSKDLRRELTRMGRRK